MTPLTVLTSAVGLGAYVAALLHQAQLRDVGHRVDVEVIEGWFSDEHIARHLMHQEAFHQDFRLALAGRRMAGSVEGRLDDERIRRLLTAWREGGRNRFCLWSGYWLPVLERYAACVPDTPIELDFCFSDAIESDSFRVHQSRQAWCDKSSGCGTTGGAPSAGVSPCPRVLRFRSRSERGGLSPTAAVGAWGPTPTC